MEIFGIFPSWFLTTTTVLFSFYLFMYTLRRNKPVPKLPPSPPKLPIIGNLHQLRGKPRYEALWDLAIEYGPVMRIHIGSRPLLVISSASMAKEILKTQDHIFCSRSPSNSTKRLTYNYLDTSFSPQSNHHREMRKILVSEFLGPKRARVFNQVLVTEIETIVQSFSLHPLDTIVSLSELFLEIVKGAVCKTAFGKNYRQQPLQGPSWEVMVDEAQELLGGSLGDSFPLLGRIIDRLSGWEGKLEKGFTNLDAYIETILDDHQNQNLAQASDAEKDFVDYLLQSSSKENASGYPLTREEMKAILMNVIMGGVDTTVISLEWALSEITRNTRVMQKLQSEIRQHAKRIQKVDELDITKMAYLKMVVKETMRLHPPAPLLIPHESISHCQVDGYDIFPKTTTMINVWGIGRDPKFWGNNAEEFYPERFENLEVGFELIPFGWGRRSCPAMNMATATIEFTIANLLYWFNWEIPDGLANEDLNMEEEGSFVVRRKLPLRLMPTKHNWES